ncbi:MAG: hypothetical protein H0V66_10615 [Bdellovibrionales bacterium]|nr:hypothetical protein [Bdellovibrionales bacterium]
MSHTEFSKIEALVSDRPGSYKNHSAEALLTSEEDFKVIFDYLPETQIWVELGSGHGLGPCLFASLHPDRKAMGVEFELARFEHSQQLQKSSALSNVEFIHADLQTCDIPDGDVYFFYFSTGLVLDRILFELGKKTHNFKIVAIESHGDLLPRLKKENWLKAFQEIPLTMQRHSPHAIVFQKSGFRQTSLHDQSFNHRYLMLEEGPGIWVGESYGLEWLQGEQYQLLVPPRTISSLQIKEILDLDELPVKYHFALQLRPLGSFTFLTSSGSKEGYLRKIYVGPSFTVELSSGERVEWSDIKKIFWETTLCYDSSADYYFFPHVV